MFGDQCGVLVGPFRLAGFDRGRQPPVQPSAIGLELRFVGHRADQRMSKRILGARGEPHLVDELRGNQLVDNRIDFQAGQQVTACLLGGELRMGLSK